MNFDFSGKTAVASGAASGMGFVFSKSFAAAGGNVVMCDITDAFSQPCVPLTAERIHRADTLERRPSHELIHKAVQDLIRRTVGVDIRFDSRNVQQMIGVFKGNKDRRNAVKKRWNIGARRLIPFDSHDGLV